MTTKEEALNNLGSAKYRHFWQQSEDSARELRAARDEWSMHKELDSLSECDLATYQLMRSRDAQ